MLLDEISEMDISLQAKLLRALQEGEIDRVGGTETVKVDVRIIATTNRNLEDWVNEGKFRQDLYFRLNVIPLRLPSLSERGDDIFELANFFVDMYTKEYKINRAIFSAEASIWLKEYAWPGNVRELQNLMERAVLLAAGKSILPAHFLLDPDNWPLFEDDEFALTDVSDSQNSSDLLNGNVDANAYANSDGSVGDNGDANAYANTGYMAENDTDAEGGTYSSGSGVSGSGNISGDFSSAAPAGDEFSGALMPLHEVERLMIKKGLVVTSGNRTQAAELLGISVRTLRNKLNEYRGLGLEME